MGHSWGVDQVKKLGDRPVTMPESDRQLLRAALHGRHSEVKKLLNGGAGAAVGAAAAAGDDGVIGLCNDISCADMALHLAACGGDGGGFTATVALLLAHGGARVRLSGAWGHCAVPGRGQRAHSNNGRARKAWRRQSCSRAGTGSRSCPPPMEAESAAADALALGPIQTSFPECSGYTLEMTSGQRARAVFGFPPKSSRGRRWSRTLRPPNSSGA